MQLPQQAPRSKPEQKDDLLTAAKKGDLPTIKRLLDAKANIEQSSANGWTPLIFAAKSGKQAAVELLLARGANVNFKNNQNYSALYAAVVGRAGKAIVQILLNAKADVQLAYHGKTAAQHALISQQHDIAQLIDPNVKVSLSVSLSPPLTSLCIFLPD